MPVSIPPSEAPASVTRIPRKPCLFQRLRGTNGRCTQLNSFPRLDKIVERMNQEGSDIDEVVLRQCVVSRRFVDREVERLFHEFFFTYMSSYFRRSLILPLSSMTLMCTLYILALIDPSRPGRAPWSPTFADFFADRETLGDELALAMILSPTIIVWLT